MTLPNVYVSIRCDVHQMKTGVFVLMQCRTSISASVGEAACFSFVKHAEAHMIFGHLSRFLLSQRNPSY